MEADLKLSGLTFETAGLDLKELVERNRGFAEQRVKGDFILKRIAEVEGIKLGNENLECGYQRIADQYNMGAVDRKSVV